MPKFNRRMLPIEAVKLTREMTVETLEGTMTGNVGDWLITGVEGEQYFCKDRIFRKTHEPTDDESEKAFCRTIPPPPKIPPINIISKGDTG